MSGKSSQNHLQVQNEVLPRSTKHREVRCVGKEQTIAYKTARQINLNCADYHTPYLDLQEWPLYKWEKKNPCM